MGVQFDLIIPPVIAGMIILILFRLNTFMMSTSVDNRLAFEMQTFAIATADLIQEEVKMAGEVGTCTSDSCSFITASGDSVRIYKSGRSLILRKRTPGHPAEIIEHTSRLESLNFKWDGNTLLDVEVRTVSVAEQEVGADDSIRVKGFSTRKVLLRNLAYKPTIN